MPIYSYSRLDAFKTCPRLYAFRYIEKPDIAAREGVEAFMGSVCHETIQQIYKDLKLSRLMTLDETLEFYEKTWEVSKPADLKVVRERYTVENYKDSGRRYVKDFYEANTPFKDGRTLGIEHRVEINLESQYMLVGFIDRLVDRGNGIYEIVDYKTNSTLPGLEELETNWQLPLYQIGLSQAFPDLKECVCTWHFLAFNKLMSIRKSAVGLKKLTSEVVSIIQKIEGTKEFGPKPSGLCSWCDYEALCPARKHFVQVESLPPEKFRDEDGVKLVDAYAAAKQKAEEAKSQMEEIEARILRFAQEKDLDAVRGSIHKVKVWRGESVKFPPKDKDPQASRAVADILKRYGLWDSYSMLQVLPLSKAIQEKKIPAEVMDELSQYVKREKIERLYLSKLDGK